MTYNILSVTTKPQIGLLYCECVDNPLTTSSLVTFSVVANHSHNPFGAKLSGLNTTTLTLGQGFWELRGFLGINNNDTQNNNCKYQFYEGGSPVGQIGASDMLGKTSVDEAYASIHVLPSSTKDIQLKFTSVNHSSGNLTVNSSYSSLVIWRVD